MNVYFDRPEWLTDVDVDEWARRTHMALCEGGYPVDPMSQLDRRGKNYSFGPGLYDKPAFDRARLLAARSLGWDITGEGLVRA